MGRTAEELKSRELFVIKQLQKGHSRKWVAAQLVEKYEVAESTANNVVQEIGSQLNKTRTELLENAKDYIIDQLMDVIDECIDKEDVKNRLSALKQLGDITKVIEEKPVDVNIRFDF